MDLLSSSVAPMVLFMLIAGGLAGFAAGLFGIGGGLIVVPTLVLFFPLIGVEPELAVHMAIGTSLSTIIVTSLRSTQAHAKKDSVDFDLIKNWGFWVTLATTVGVLVGTSLRAKTVLLLFASFLFILAFKFMFPKFFAQFKLGDEMPGGVLKIFYSFILGSASALFGIGGGSIIIVIMTLYGRPIHQAIGTASGFGVVIAIVGTISSIVTGWGLQGLPAASLGYVNLIAFGCIIVTSIVTAPLGAKLAHKFDSALMKRVFGVYLIFTSLLMFWKNL